jgi:hypothetical protein
MDDEEDEEDIGSQLRRIKAAQQPCGQDSEESSGEEQEDVRQPLILTGGSDALSQQGFSQELSQSQAFSEQYKYCQQPSPFEQQRAQLLAKTPTELAAVHAKWTNIEALRAAPNAAMEGADYLSDPFSPWAPGGFMAVRHTPPLPPSSRAASPHVQAASPQLLVLHLQQRKSLPQRRKLRQKRRKKRNFNAISIL